MRYGRSVGWGAISLEGAEVEVQLKSASEVEVVHEAMHMTMLGALFRAWSGPYR